MQTKEQGKRAKEYLNNTVLCEDGTKMSIHHSKLERIKFQKQNNSGGVGIKYNKIIKKF